VSAALAGALDEGMFLVSEGDRAWFEGDRRAAVQSYRLAVRTGEPEVVAMARVRLLSFSGTLGPAWHGPTISRALAAGDGAWGRLAWVDFFLLSPAGFGGDADKAEEIALQLEGELASFAWSRLYAATGDEQWLEKLSALDPGARDGLGEGQVNLQATLPEHPGTWSLGLGLVASADNGVGLQASLSHPDLFLQAWELGSTAWATLDGSRSVSLALDSPGPVAMRLGGLTQRVIERRYTDDGTHTLSHGWHQASLGPGFEWWHADLNLAAVTRSDVFDDATYLAVGGRAEVVLDHRENADARYWGWYVATSSDATMGDYSRLELGADARCFLPAWRGSLAARSTASWEITGSAPWFVQPAAGGSILLRGAPVNRYRSPLVITADVEYRLRLTDVFGLAAFSSNAWTADHSFIPGGGFGLRVRPTWLKPDMPLRWDVAATMDSWGFYVGMGEAF